MFLTQVPVALPSLHKNEDIGTGLRDHLVSKYFTGSLNHALECFTGSLNHWTGVFNGFTKPLECFMYSRSWESKI